MAEMTKPVFGVTTEEFRKAFCSFAKGSEGQVWESDLELLLELAFGADLRHSRGWKVYNKRTCCLDDGLVSVEGVLEWIRKDLTPLISECSSRGLAVPGCRKLSHSSFCDLVETFNQFDADGNGVICAKDLRFALKQLTGSSPSLEDCRTMIRRVDANYDGVVDLAEFVHMMNQPKLGPRLAKA